MAGKGQSTKTVEGPLVWKNAQWCVVRGKLKASRGRPQKTAHLFQYVAEKLPFACLSDVEKHLKSEGHGTDGVYLAHDSMGVARYGGRGQIFVRLRSHFKKYPKELVYFSFYIIASKNHEREIETAIIRGAGPQLMLNERKIRAGIEPGHVGDYEPRTRFFERQRIRGKKRKVKRGRPRKQVAA
jgi:hypothetical protein